MKALLNPQLPSEKEVDLPRFSPNRKKETQYLKPALAHLCQLADQHKAEKYPNAPYKVKSQYSDKSANDLTHCIVDWFNLNGHFATRLQSTGQYRDDLKKFVPSQQRAGLPDVFAVVDGRAVFVEVKFGKDRLSDVQKEAISELIAAGASVYIAHDFQGFYSWFNALLLTFDGEGELPFGPVAL